METSPSRILSVQQHMLFIYTPEYIVQPTADEDPCAELVMYVGDGEGTRGTPTGYTVVNTSRYVSYRHHVIHVRPLYSI